MRLLKPLFLHGQFVQLCFLPSFLAKLGVNTYSTESLHREFVVSVHLYYYHLDSLRVD